MNSAVRTDIAAPVIRTRANPKCILCGSQGDVLYKQIRDPRFEAPGEWNLKRCRNPKCGLLWLDPLPLEEDLHIAYETYPTHLTGLSSPTKSEPARTRSFADRVRGYIAAGYMAYRWNYDPFHASSVQKLFGRLMYLQPLARANANRSIVFLRVQPGGHVLEIGCGSGWMLRRLKDAGWKATGIDFDPAAVDAARSLGLEDISVNSLEKCAYKDASFDAVIMSDVIEHLYDPAGTVRECARILKPGGTLVVLTPNSSSLGHRVFKRSWIHIHPPEHLHLFRPQLLREMARRAGFEQARTLTTAHWADCAFAGSLAIKRTGRSGEPNIPNRRWARMAACGEWLALLLKPTLGEECALLATKGPAARISRPA